MVVQNSAGALSCEALRRNQSTALKIVTARPVPNKKMLTGVGIRSAFGGRIPSLGLDATCQELTSPKKLPESNFGRGNPSTSWYISAL